ncbi:PEP-CTERM sorting domain-containing protein [Nostocaceae cyanobacterium CENA357]|uniref:PEP-CTERM sorting domain-containing protein n=1 Tax=Atlanticothrix silvestris CENA357 TaxID=1725252 RepID=A0A8J7L5D5_9CYAN|nr:PEP-CTERM sorting domain-containing protein [Atlanticothrix silvestris]MBH8552952.1 PEP-CTERM sorting domain-containing protein [Atlanticothrix silvestris CENA357]
MKLTQRLWIATATVAINLSILKSASVHAVTLNFEWTGNAGYSARGYFTYDETQGYSIVDESKLQSLTIDFFDPSNKLLNSFAPITNGSIVYDFLDFNYDTTIKSFFGFFDVGKDDGQSTDYYLFETVGLNLSLRNPIQGTIDQNNGLINVTETTSVPEPLTIGGTVVAVGIGCLMKRKQITAKKAKL